MIRLPEVSGSCSGGGGKKEQGWVGVGVSGILTFIMGESPWLPGSQWETFVNIAVPHSRSYRC